MAQSMCLTVWQVRLGACQTVIHLPLPVDEARVLYCFVGVEMRRGGPDILRLVSIGLIVASVALLFYQMVVYSRQRAHMPRGLTIAGVAVGGLNQTEAVERILQTDSTPIELRYNDQIIHLSPASVGFTLDTEVMLAAAELTRTGYRCGDLPAA